MVDHIKGCTEVQEQQKGEGNRVREMRRLLMTLTGGNFGYCEGGGNHTGRDHRDYWIRSGSEVEEVETKLEEITEIIGLELVVKWMDIIT